MVSSRDIERLVKPHLDVQRIHLFDVKVSGRAGRPLIQLFVDLESESITIEECARISREVQDLLDIQEWMPGDYRLIVSSPGIGYPLREIWQFRKNIGRTIQAIHGDNIITGKLTAVYDDGRLVLETDEQNITFDYKNQISAKVVVEKPGKPKFKRKGNEARNR